MLQMEKQNYLSNLSQFEGLSLREIANRSGHHFNTVKKYVDREDWNDIFADTKITAALLDRIIHHSHLLDFTCRESRRLKDALLNRTA